MIFSVGYGRDENGKLTMNFGPLNREGGQRRLNVAITRARRRVEVVASITGTEPEFNADLKEGVRHLRRYLDYAAPRAPLRSRSNSATSGLDAESPFEEEVIRTIRSWGYDAVPASRDRRLPRRHRRQAPRARPAASRSVSNATDGCTTPPRSRATATGCARRFSSDSAGGSTASGAPPGTATATNRNSASGSDRGRDPRRSVSASTTALTGQHRDAKRTEFDAVSLDEAPSWTVPYDVATPTVNRARLPELHLPEAQWHAYAG